jgi:type II secretory pathway pseudopilin PulG
MEKAKKPTFNWPMLVVVILVIGAFAVIIRPVILRAHRDVDLTKAIGNTKQLGLALLEFETEYGTYPDENTAAVVLKNTKTTLNLTGHSANSYFRQLLATEMAQSETMFYCKTAFSKKPDNRFDTPETALAPGEVSFGYILKGKTAFTTKDNPARPLLCAPLAYDGKSVSNHRFDPIPFDRRAAILRIDNSVTSLPIDPKTGEPTLKDGKTLLQTGPKTIWGTDTPTIIPPLPKP